jgi:hypothetical protein
MAAVYVIEMLNLDTIGLRKENQSYEDIQDKTNYFPRECLIQNNAFILSTAFLYHISRLHYHDRNVLLILKEVSLHLYLYYIRNLVNYFEFYISKRRVHIMRI